MINEKELEIIQTKLKNGKRVIRIVHLPTGISVEDDGNSTSLEPLVERRNKLIKELASLIARSKGNSPSDSKSSR